MSGTSFGFAIKKPGLYYDDGPEDSDLRPEPETYGSAADEAWQLRLPHRCDEWIIGLGSKEHVLAEAREFSRQLDEAIGRLERMQA